MKEDNAKVSVDEKPKVQIAEQVVTHKRKYFSPTVGTVEAETLQEASDKIRAMEASTEQKGKVING